MHPIFGILIFTTVFYFPFLFISVNFNAFMCLGEVKKFWALSLSTNTPLKIIFNHMSINFQDVFTYLVFIFRQPLPIKTNHPLATRALKFFEKFWKHSYFLSFDYSFLRELGLRDTRRSILLFAANQNSLIYKHRNLLYQKLYFPTYRKTSYCVHGCSYGFKIGGAQL